MKMFLWNLLLALFWACATGTFSFPNLLLGFAIGMLVLAVAQIKGRSKRYVWRCWKWIDLFAFSIRELFAANLKVIHDVLTPRHHMRAGVIAVPLAVQSDAEIAVLTSLISLTPGTLCLDVSPDRNELYIHAMYIQDVESFRNQIKTGFERRVLEAMRPDWNS